MTEQELKIILKYIDTEKKMDFVLEYIKAKKILTELTPITIVECDNCGEGTTKKANYCVYNFCKVCTERLQSLTQ